MSIQNLLDTKAYMNNQLSVELKIFVYNKHSRFQR